MAELFYETTGQGDPILFVHGLGGTSNVFHPQTTALSRNFTCIVPDLPGSGRNSAIGVTIAGLVDYLAAVLDATADGEDVHLVGHSMGSLVVQHLAVRLGRRVRSVTLVGPIHVPPEPARIALRDRAGKARSGDMTGIADAIVAGGISVRSRTAEPAVAALVREMILRQPPEGYAASCEALAAAEAADVAAIVAPVLLLTGNEDGTSPPAAVRKLADLLPDAVYRILDACGHWMTFERPFDVNAALENFLIAGQR